MFAIGNGSITDIVNDSHSRLVLGTVLQNILFSYEPFKCSFTKVDNNYLKVPIYCNEAFGFGRGNMNHLDEFFFGTGNDMVSDLSPRNDPSFTQQSCSSMGGGGVSLDRQRWLKRWLMQKIGYYSRGFSYLYDGQKNFITQKNCQDKTSTLDHL
jgi:hypothetical protein